MQNAATQFMFRLGQKVIHAKGGEYVIEGLPDTYVLEHNRKPAYAYRMADGRVCVRAQDEMEDGRFVPAPCAGIPAAILVN
jgi:hypothetical protein